MNKFVIYIAALALLPSAAAAGGCGDGECFVGAVGTGGEASGGNSQGFLIREPGHINPDRTISSSGNELSGHLNIAEDGRSIGSQSGTFRQDTVRGHFSGIQGDMSGQCDPFGDPLVDPDACP